MNTMLDYLTSNKGKNLTRISPNIRLIESNYLFEGGTIDILARDGICALGIKVGFDYNLCSTLKNYLNYMPAGIVLYVAPEINNEIYYNLKDYYNRGKLKFYEYSPHEDEFIFNEIKPSNMKSLITRKDESKSTLNVSNKNKENKIEFIASSIVDMMPRKYSNLKKAYRLFKAL